MVKQPAPISLRIRAADANYRARKVLRRLDEADHLQRQVRWTAMRAVIEIRKLRSIAGPKLRAMLELERNNWVNDCKAAETILLKIVKGGVG